ncbi:alpha/beta hydrolase fold domain-containing protein [Nonomuraea insulae]|uniref:Alpha/beta hydrolase fold domain-containing protein n=1 Tax=Nonomuraea insulae TaxID=1616787 RepID=A0ABW1D621_9ACTN
MADQAHEASVLSFQTPDAVELRHLRGFIVVAEELNFGRAASRLYISQPALSRQIRMLERLLGCDLLRRSTHRVELTLAGEALLDRARQLLDDLDEAISVTRSVGGEHAGRIARLWEGSQIAAADADIQELRSGYEALQSPFEAPPEVDIRPVNAGGVACLWLTPRPKQPSPTVLFLHGGGYVAGSAYGYRPLAGRLAAAASSGILLPEYRLAPEHPFPAAVEDALSTFQWLLDSGTRPEEVTVAGDSSGAGLALSLLISLRERGLPMPGRAALMCPWVDLTGSHEPTPGPQEDPSQPVMPSVQLRRFTDAYLGGYAADDDPLLNPLTTDLTGLPPMLIQAGTGDPRTTDARRLAEHARGYGVDAQLELYPVAAHVFQLYWSFLPEAADAIDQLASFIAPHENSTARKA